jgi:flagellar hook-associated protein 3 FlgL
MRLGFANTYDNALQNLYLRQSDLSSQQEKLTSGKNVNRPSDDPTASAVAERALTRISRVDTEQRALGVQRNAITMAESTLADATGLIQDIRDLVVNSGNGGFNATSRATIASQMRGLRDQLFSVANRTDTNGIPLFGGLGSSANPFTDSVAGITFNGTPGQRSSTEVALPSAMDGQAIWMNVPTGNGTFEASLPGTNTGLLSTDAGQVTSPAALTGHSYSVNFTVAAGVTTYDVVDTTTSATLASGQPYVNNQAIAFDGMSFVAHGAPANGDSVQLTPSTASNVFKVIDDAIASIDSSPGGPQLSQAIALALSQIDTSMDRIQSARGQAGDWLNRADKISATQTGRSIQLEAEKSKAEDLDMVKGISDFSKIQTGYQAALQSYAQVQKLSLFNFIN